MEQPKQIPVGPYHEAIGELYMANKALAAKIQEQAKFLEAFEKANKELEAAKVK